MTFKAETGSKGFVKNRKIHLALKKKKSVQTSNIVERQKD